MAGYKDRLEIKEGTSSSSGSDDVTESSGSSSADESLQAKLPPIRDVGSTVEFPEEVNQKSQKLKKKKRLTKRERSAKLLAKRELDRMCMVKPNAVSDREEERILIRRATKGVVHLFNAVAERQKELGAKLALKDKGGKGLLARELGSAAFKKKLAQKLALKDEDRNSETREEWLSDSDMKEEPLRKGQDLMDTSEVKTEPESDDD
uniref:RRP15-like protein n=1 Tax=Parascaris univalens TaxID=6257 RepID=A0A915AHH9_PARUN